MLLLPRSVRILLAAKPVDMRNSIDGLAAIIRNEWKEDLYAGDLFIFVSRRGDRTKVLTWDNGGFVLFCEGRQGENGLGASRIPSTDPALLEVTARFLILLFALSTCDDHVTAAHGGDSKQGAPSSTRPCNSAKDLRRAHRRKPQGLSNIQEDRRG